MMDITLDKKEVRRRFQLKRIIELLMYFANNLGREITLKMIQDHLQYSDSQTYNLLSELEGFRMITSSHADDNRKKTYTITDKGLSYAKRISNKCSIRNTLKNGEEQLPIIDNDNRFSKQQDPESIKDLSVPSQ